MWLSIVALHEQSLKFVDFMPSVVQFWIGLSLGLCKSSAVQCPHTHTLGAMLVDDVKC